MRIQMIPHCSYLVILINVLGDKQDVDYTIDPSVPQRQCVDKMSKQAEQFLEFLKDSRFCVLNGWLDTSSDKYTCFTYRGQSVADYTCTQYEYLKYVDKFCVKSICDILIDHDIQQN